MGAMKYLVCDAKGILAIGETEDEVNKRYLKLIAQDPAKNIGRQIYVCKIVRHVKVKWIVEDVE